MGYCTRYDGKIKMNNDKVKNLVRYIFLDDSDCDGTMNDWGNHLFESEIKGDILIINEDRKNYEGEMEVIFSLIVHFDKKATGEIVAVGEDGEGQEKFILENGKVFREEGYLAYKDKKDITEEPYDLEEKEEELNRFENKTICDSCEKPVPGKFNFKDRGYYDEIIEETKHKELCDKCYKKIKEPFARKRKLEQELNLVNSEIHGVKEGGNE